jgi:hypothetical protein
VIVGDDHVGGAVGDWHARHDFTRYPLEWTDHDGLKGRPRPAPLGRQRSAPVALQTNHPGRPDDHHTASIASTDAEPGSPTLRFVTEPAALHTVRRERRSPARFERSKAASRDHASPILIAASDRVSRAEVLDSLAEMMGPDAVFEQAETFSEVLLRAPASRMVVLSGELDGIPPESLRHKLAHRHPDLPVATLDARAQRAGARS